MWHRSDRGGFTLIEMAIVVSILAILGGIALPNLRSVVFRADAARIVSDVHTVTLAVDQFVEANGRLPRTGAWGQSPVDLSQYIGNMTFQYKTTEYRLIRNNRRGTVRLRVRYPRRDLIGEALSRYRRAGLVVWNRRRTDFYIVN